MLSSLLVKVSIGVAAKLGLDKLSEHGYMPRSTYLSRSLKALQRDDLDGAIHNYHLAIKHREVNDKTDIVKENIQAAIDVRIMRLEQQATELAVDLYPPKWSWKNLTLWLQLKFDQDKQATYVHNEELHASCLTGVEVLNGLKAKLE